MSKIGVQGQFYLGVVADYQGGPDFRITADIPGVIQGVNAFPLRGDCDEPKPGDPIILLGLDPDYNSYYLYWKLKENDFTGFRVMGQQISFDKEKGIRISIDSRETPEYTPNFPKDDERLAGEVSHIDLSLQGDIEIGNSSNTTLQIDRNGNVHIKLSPASGLVIDSSGGSIRLLGSGILDLGSLTVGGEAAGFAVGTTSTAISSVVEFGKEI